MKISKYLHSCLVFEKDNFKLLIDPGTFSFAEGLITADEFDNVNAILITHIHPDHLDKDNLKKIVELSDAPVYTVAQVQEVLKKEEIASELIPEAIGPFNLERIPVRHELILDNPLPEMMGLLIDGKVLHPVDSFDDKLLQYTGAELLLLPIMAPFTTEPIVAAFADKIQPKQILPVHDGFAKPFFLRQRYDNYKRHFERQGIRFHDLMMIGATIEV